MCGNQLAQKNGLEPVPRKQYKFVPFEDNAPQRTDEARTYLGDHDEWRSEIRKLTKMLIIQTKRVCELIFDISEKLG